MNSKKLFLQAELGSTSNEATASIDDDIYGVEDVNMYQFP